MPGPADLPLAGLRVGVTAARKAAEQSALLERRGAEVVWAPALSVDPYRVDAEALRALTAEVVAEPVDLLLGTTGIGMRTWFRAAEADGTLDGLVAHLDRAEIVARGPKTVGALRQRGLREDWVSPVEEVADMVRHLDGRDLTGRRVVLQEYGQALDGEAATLRERGAEVVVVTIYRVEDVDDAGPLLALVREVAAGRVDAVTFTSPPAVRALMGLAESEGHDAAVARAFGSTVVASCVGPVTAAAFEDWEIPTIHPDRSRLGAMVKQLESTLVERAAGTTR
ncbi:uroporphyrinogen-III synthase [Nocardioides sp.]|uniref:uroporphyrinogen-III synthase n=1 Tax=Nocardioides sp. TaxID=35761 RepID=UPI00271E3151|nr:uroporphyrinogen-III synthase [Nocardioides sp.]MDO9455591.1 uroporphyrinogen-III synthase [Nocardioides sp.]